MDARLAGLDAKLPAARSPRERRAAGSTFGKTAAVIRAAASHAQREPVVPSCTVMRRESAGSGR